MNNPDTRTNQTVADAPPSCPNCGSSEIDEHHTHVECVVCGWGADYDPIPCKKCGDEADVMLHGRFPFCKDHYMEVIQS